jgi:DNA-binding response OmpR family regulator
MKILIHDERSDTLEFISESIKHLGYNVGIAKGCPAINQMLAEKEYDVILTNGGLQNLDPDRSIRSKFPLIYIVGITSSQQNSVGADANVDCYLLRPFEKSKLLQALEKPSHF